MASAHHVVVAAAALAAEQQGDAQTEPESEELGAARSLVKAFSDITVA